MTSSIQSSIVPVSIVIPTYGRDQVLIDTINSLLKLTIRAAEIIIVDQSVTHDEPTLNQLDKWHECSVINWIKLKKPSQPAAMNAGINVATSPACLFLDDDIIAYEGLVEQHWLALNEQGIWAVVGQVIQPWQKPEKITFQGSKTGIYADLEFPFYSSVPAIVKNVMSGNLTVWKDKAIKIGAFNEYFAGAAYRFDTEFARRVIRNKGTIKFNPLARIDHLRAERGGTRIQGSHLASADPVHTMGDYYFAMKEGLSLGMLYYILKRPFREVATKFHLKHPWYIPVKLIGELRGFLWALSLLRK